MGRAEIAVLKLMQNLAPYLQVTKRKYNVPDFITVIQGGIFITDQGNMRLAVDFVVELTKLCLLWQCTYHSRALK